MSGGWRAAAWCALAASVVWAMSAAAAEPYADQGDDPWADDLALVIVEPREHPDLEAVLRNVRERAPARASMVVCHGTRNGAFARRAARGLARTSFVELPHANLTPDQYNELFKTEAFWEGIPGEHVLVFQTDAALCANSPYALRDFKDYAYVGCSYGTGEVGKDAAWGPESSFYGVGGLSMRRRSAMLACIRGMPPVRASFPEDAFFSTCMDRLPLEARTPESDEVLQKFCTQNHHELPALGAHQVRLASAEQRAAFAAHCPEATWLHR